MAKFELIDNLSNVVEVKVRDVKPSNPKGKPQYRWVEVIESNSPFKYHDSTVNVVYDDSTKRQLYSATIINPDKVKSECSNMIVSKINDAEQRNMTALSLRKAVELIDENTKVLSNIAASKPFDMTNYNKAAASMAFITSTAIGIQDWIAAMQQACKDSIANGKDPVWVDWDDSWDAVIKMV